MITVTVHGDEAVFRLDQIPRKLRMALREKYEKIFGELGIDLAERMPQKYLDARQVEVGVSDIGNTVVGYLQYADKTEKYPILPKSAMFLQFHGAMDGRWVRTHLVMHPYPKGVPFVEEYLRLQKPWIVEQLAEAV